MDRYEEQVMQELANWKSDISGPSKPLQQLTKHVQNKINGWIPERVHNVITESIKNMVRAVLFGAEYTTKKRDVTGIPLIELDRRVMDKLNIYKKTAAAEGAGTGAGGILLALADFPLLLGIKMKFLFEAASLYGFDTERYDERLFILHVFQLAFSGDGHRVKTLQTIERWDDVKHEITNVDWRVFQQEYRDYIDFVKMLQMIPGVGAVVGAYANYNLLDQLGKVTVNCYRMRLLKSGTYKK